MTSIRVVDAFSRLKQLVVNCLWLEYWAISCCACYCHFVFVVEVIMDFNHNVERNPYLASEVQFHFNAVPEPRQLIFQVAIFLLCVIGWILQFGWIVIELEGIYLVLKIEGYIGRFLYFYENLFVPLICNCKWWSTPWIQCCSWHYQNSWWYLQKWLWHWNIQLCRNIWNYFWFFLIFIHIHIKDVVRCQSMPLSIKSDETHGQVYGGIWTNEIINILVCADHGWFLIVLFLLYKLSLYFYDFIGDVLQIYLVNLLVFCQYNIMDLLTWSNLKNCFFPFIFDDFGYPDRSKSH